MLTPDVSVSLIKDKSHVTTGSLMAGASALFGIGVRAGGTVEASPKVQISRRKQTETSGWVNTKQKSGGGETALNLTIGAVSSASAKMKSPADEKLKDIGIPIQELKSFQLSLFRAGRATHDSIIVRNGSTHKLSSRIIAHQTAQSFVDSATKNLAEIAKTRVDRYADNLPFRVLSESKDGKRIELFGSDATKTATIKGRINDKEKEMKETLLRVLREQHPSKVYKEYFELTEKAVEQSNKIRALIADYLALGKKDEAGQCEEYLKLLHAHPDSWETSFYVISEREAKEEKTELSAFIGSQRISAISARNIDIGG